MVINQELMKIFSFWGAILVLKMLAMIPMTVRQRFGKKVFANSEDTFLLPKSKVSYDDPDVERIRRAHRNDLENILPWFIITYLWLTTGPSVWLATQLIRGFVIMRIIHTLVYAIYSHQPTRAIVFFIAYFIMAYEAVSTLLYYT